MIGPEYLLHTNHHLFQPFGCLGCLDLTQPVTVVRLGTPAFGALGGSSDQLIYGRSDNSRRTRGRAAPSFDGICDPLANSAFCCDVGGSAGIR